MAVSGVAEGRALAFSGAVPSLTIGSHGVKDVLGDVELADVLVLNELPDQFGRGGFLGLVEARGKFVFPVLVGEVVV